MPGRASASLAFPRRSPLSRSTLAAIAALLALAGCAPDAAPTLTHKSESAVVERSGLAAFRAHGADVSKLLDLALAPRPKNGAYVLSTRASETRDVQTVAAIAPSNATGALQLSVRDLSAPVVFRATNVDGDARLEDRHLVYEGAQTKSVLFARPDAIESIVRLTRKAALAYAVEHASGTTLRRVEDGHGGAIEVVEAGEPRLRMTADRAWDANGKPLRVVLALVGDRVEVRLPSDAQYPVAIDPSWSSTTTPVRLRTGHTATTLGDGRVLIAGGNGTASAEVFDVVTGRFHPVGSMSEVRFGHYAVKLADGRVLVGGGRASFSAASKTAEIFDPTTNTFTPTTGVMTATHAGGGAVRLPSGKVLVTGGGTTIADVFDPATGTFTAAAGKGSAQGTPVLLSTGDVLIPTDGTSEIYKPSTGTFTSVAAPTPGSGGGFGLDTFTGVGLRDGRALVFGITMAASTGTSTFYNSAAYVYDAASKTFTATANMAKPPNGHGLLLPSGKVLHVGDGTGGEVWDPATGKWIDVSPVPSGHSGATLTPLPSGDVLVVGGTAGSVDLWLAQDPSGPGSWSATGTLTRNRSGAKATLLLDGRVLLTGGRATVGASADPGATAEIYNPASGTFGSLLNLAASRTEHAQVLLPSGKVLIVGSSTTAEIFDPASGTSAMTGAMSTARSRPGIVLLADGKVLVAGGGKDTAEIYDPATGTFGTPIKMTASRYISSAVRLTTGKVLVVDANSADLFDPATSTFTATSAPVGTYREPDTTTLLLGGDVLLGGGPTAAFERYGASGASPILTQSATSNLRQRMPATLPGGRVLFAGGIDGGGEITSTEVLAFDPLAAASVGDFVSSGTLVTPLYTHTSTWLPSGGALVAGGDTCVICISTGPMGTSRYRDRANDAWRPVIAGAPTSVVSGASFSVTGSRFAGVSGGECGDNANGPSVLWIPASGQGQVLGKVSAFSDTSAQVTLPATALYGKGWLVMVSDGIASAASPVEITAADKGTTCGTAAECASGFCVDGVCCDTACDGVCQACTKAKKGSGDDGVCGAIPPGKDPKDACALFQGAKCADGSECATGICVDGVCCDTACTGQCEACNVEGSTGTCVPVLGEPHATRTPCDAGDAMCGAKRCDGKDRATCAGFSPSTTSCRTASCKDGVETLAATCDGMGACPAAQTKNCEPFACGDTDCLTKCSVDTECAPNYRCAAGKCVTGGYCDGDHTVMIPGGASKDCTPLKCEGDHCKESCASSDDCVGGYLCQNGQCISATPTNVDTGSSGCGCRVLPEGGSARGVLAAIAACLAIGLRRRKR